ncbi:MAG: hypothetical protein LUO87_00115 [Methanomicrobiales archaeon]|nr:hypothetical protein [Methanomicrobiales archaeon]
MPRELNDRDREILKKLAPECTELICQGSGVPFRSLLPPVANHFARDEADFRERIERLTDGELRYLSDLVLAGEESLGCVPPDFLEIFLWRVAERLGNDAAVRIVETAAAAECPYSEAADRGPEGP